MALSPGTTIGHYDVTAPLDEGGMGQVNRARNLPKHLEMVGEMADPS